MPHHPQVQGRIVERAAAKQQLAALDFDFLAVNFVFAGHDFDIAGTARGQLRRLDHAKVALQFALERGRFEKHLLAEHDAHIGEDRHAAAFGFRNFAVLIANDHRVAGGVDHARPFAARSDERSGDGDLAFDPSQLWGEVEFEIRADLHLDVGGFDGLKIFARHRQGKLQFRGIELAGDLQLARFRIDRTL